MSGLAGHGTAVVRTRDGRVQLVRLRHAGARRGRTQLGGAVPAHGRPRRPLPIAAHGFAAMHTWRVRTHGRRTGGGARRRPRPARRPARGVPGSDDRPPRRPPRPDPGARASSSTDDGRPLRPPRRRRRRVTPGHARVRRDAARVDDRRRELWRHGPIADAFSPGWGGTGAGSPRRDLSAMRRPRRWARPCESRSTASRLHGPPGTAGFPFVAQALHLWAEPATARAGVGGVLHRLVEIFRLAFADRDLLAGDPEGGGADPARFLEPSVPAASRHRARRPTAARNRAPWAGTAPADLDAGCTTHVNAVDADGMAVAGTFTLGHPFGAAVVVPETGTLLPNVLYQFARNARPSERDPRGPPTRVERLPDARHAGREFVAALGAPGARRIPTALVQAPVGAPPLRPVAAEAAIDLPRVHAEDDLVELDDRAPDEVARRPTPARSRRAARPRGALERQLRASDVHRGPDRRRRWLWSRCGRLATAVGVPTRTRRTLTQPTERLSASRLPSHPSPSWPPTRRTRDATAAPRR